MANEKLTIAKDKARLSVIGNSYPDTLTNSGEGLDIPQLIIEILTDLDIDLPDIDPDDWDNLPIVIGLDEDDMPVIEFPDPDFDPDLHPGELPDIIDWPLPDLDWDDLIAGLEDLGIDPGILTDLRFTGLDANGLQSIVGLDADFKIVEEELPTYIEIVTQPQKIKYSHGQLINISGMRVVPKKEDGSTWTDATYFRGYIPLQELIVSPLRADFTKSVKVGMTSTLDTNWEQPIPVYGSASSYYNVGTGDLHETDVGSLLVKENDNFRKTVVPVGKDRDSLGQEIIENLTTGETLVIDIAHSYLAIMSVTIAGKTAYYAHTSNNVFRQTGAQPFVTDRGWPDENTIWTAVFGELEGGTQEITISWARPGDGMLLSASFEITVEEPGGGGR